MRLVPLLLLLPFFAVAQVPAKIPKVCLLAFDPPDLVRSRFNLFFQGLRELGYVEGRNIAIEIRAADSVPAKYPALARECVQSQADVIVATTTPAAQAAKQATTTIPIVMNPLGDPLGTGLVKSLARPEGNITGLTFMAPTLAAKRLSLLKEALPQLSRVLVLSHLVDPIAPLQVAAMRRVAQSLGMELHVHDIRTAEDYARGFEAGKRAKVEAVIVTSESISFVNRAQIMELVARYRLPSMLWSLAFVEGGALMGYMPDFSVFSPRTAYYVDRILKGAKPSELPIEQPTKFIFAVNLKTAKALGISIPQPVLLRADKIIE